MFRQKISWCLCPVVMVVALLSTASAPAGIVTGDLLLYLDAGDADGDNIAGVGTNYSVWKNKAHTGATYDATPQGNVVWDGDGSPANPFVMRFIQTEPFNYPASAQGYAKVANSGSGSDLDRSVFTYEVWAEINGPGSGQGNTSMFFENAALISHGGVYDGGNGMINYTLTGSWQAPEDTLYCGDQWTPVEKVLPGSNGLIGDGLMHHIVLTRGGDGDTDTAWYLDGVLKGTFQSPSAASDVLMTIAARNRWGSVYDQGSNADIALVRVYGDTLSEEEVLQNFNAGLVVEALAIIPGDANSDGKVDAADAATLASNWLSTEATWVMGDFNDDGNVNDLDATILAANWQAPAAASVPEPSALVLLLVLPLVLSLRRRS